MRTLCMAAVLLATIWLVNRTHSPGGQAWVRPHENGLGPARILRFYASAGAVVPGQSLPILRSASAHFTVVPGTPS